MTNCKPDKILLTAESIDNQPKTPNANSESNSVKQAVSTCEVALDAPRGDMLTCNNTVRGLGMIGQVPYIRHTINTTF